MRSLVLIAWLALLTQLTACAAEECAAPLLRKCVVSLVSGDNYALGATVLARSLRATESIDNATRLVAIVPRGGLSETSMAWLKARGGFDIVHPPEYANDEVLGGMRKDLASKRMAAAKLFAWTLEDCTRLLYMDSDSFARFRVDFLDRDEYWTGNISGVQEYDLARDEFKGGHLAIRPGRATYDALMALLSSATNLTNSDQTLLNLAFKDEWQRKPVPERLPREGLLCSAYCVLVAYKPAQYTAIFNRMLASAVVMDFQGQSKPWNFPQPGAMAMRACEVLFPFVYAWVALAVSADVHTAALALSPSQFGKMQTVFDLMQAAHTAFSTGDLVTKAYYQAVARSVRNVVDLTQVFIA